MSQTWLISGPPGCGKTSWILTTIRSHPGSCGYLRLSGLSEDGLEQGHDAGIDLAWLKDQCPQLQDLSKPDQQCADRIDDQLNLIELQQYRPPAHPGVDEIDPRISNQLKALQLQPDRALHFGREPELPEQDTLEFNRLEAWSVSLHDSVWDPNSLSSFWFELVNGAYGDVYRAKALMNLPDGRAFFCNWIVSQQGSQFLPLEVVEPPTGRPNRASELVVQGKALDGMGMQSTINDCLLSDAVLDMHQAPLREQQPDLSQAKR